jgi:hypothetical protein
MASAMNTGSFSGVCGDLFLILLEIGVVDVEDVVDEKRYRPRRIIPAPFSVQAVARATVPPQQKSIPLFSKTLAVRKSATAISPMVSAEVFPVVDSCMVCILSSICQPKTELRIVT